MQNRFESENTKRLCRDRLTDRMPYQLCQWSIDGGASCADLSLSDNWSYRYYQTVCVFVHYTLQPEAIDILAETDSFMDGYIVHLFPYKRIGSSLNLV
jgi:hypothetical protein